MTIDLEPLYRYHMNILAEEPGNKTRYLAASIDWSETAIMLVGERGVGKTTLLLQYARQRYQAMSEFLYISADFYQLEEMGLYRSIDSYFATTSGKCVIIDEIHQYPGWKKELKNLLDAYKSKQFLISGSSTLHLTEGTDTGKEKKTTTVTDLQRRRTVYELRPLSFREYLDFRFEVALPPFSLQDIVRRSLDCSHTVMQALKAIDLPVLKAFEDYLGSGYYPYFRDAPRSYALRLEQTVSTVLSKDIALAMDLDSSGVAKLKKLFAVIASSKPMAPNINALARELGATRDTIYKYISYLERAGLIRTIYADITKVGHILNRPDKICISNPNLLQIAFDARLSSEKRGALRESFFVSNFTPSQITVAKDGDFCVEDMIFEVGGPNKQASQIAHHATAFVVRDGQEIPAGRTLPLWLFGCLY